MKEKLKSNEIFIYEIIDPSVEETERFIVKGNVNPENMDSLLFYLQYEFHKMLKEATLIPFDIENILIKYYGFEGLENIDDSEIDVVFNLIDNVERNLRTLNKDHFIINRNLFYIDGILNDMKDIMIDIVYNNPNIFPKEFLALVIEKDGNRYFPITSRLFNEVNSFIEK